MRNKVLLILVFLPLWAFSQNCNYLLWSDEFDYSGAPNPEKWGYDTGGHGWGNNELQDYTNTRVNSYVENGKLIIKAVKQNNKWTSARMVTRQKGDWLYGRIEVSAKLPTGKGTWPAVWMLPTDWNYGGWPASGEIDIMEHVGYDQNKVHGSIHTEAFNHKIGTQKGGSRIIPTASTQFHAYAIEWSESKIDFFIDDQLYFTFKNENKTYKEWPFDKRFHLLLNIAIGGDWGAAMGMDPNLTQAVMEVDYVRVYSQKPKNPVVDGPTLVVTGAEATFSTHSDKNFQYRWIYPSDATVVGGAGSNQITLRWGKQSGNVQVELTSACDTLLSDAFPVMVASSDNSFIIPNSFNESINWIAFPGHASNSLNISTIGNGSARVDFDVQAPTANAFVEYLFAKPIDLSKHRSMVLKINTEAGSAPSNLRIDLIDKQGLTLLENLFKIDEVKATGIFETYTHNFGSSTSGFNFAQVEKIRIYVNYGIFGKKGRGHFIFEPIEMKKDLSNTVQAVNNHDKLANYRVEKGFISIGLQTEQPVAFTLFDLTGKQVLHESALLKQTVVPTSLLTNGLYIVYFQSRTGQIQTGKVFVRLN